MGKGKKEQAYIGIFRLMFMMILFLLTDQIKIKVFNDFSQLIIPISVLYLVDYGKRTHPKVEG